MGRKWYKDSGMMKKYKMTNQQLGKGWFEDTVTDNLFLCCRIIKNDSTSDLYTSLTRDSIESKRQTNLELKTYNNEKSFNTFCTFVTWNPTRTRSMLVILQTLTISYLCPTTLMNSKRYWLQDSSTATLLIGYLSAFASLKKPSRRLIHGCNYRKGYGRSSSIQLQWNSPPSNYHWNYYKEQCCCPE